MCAILMLPAAKVDAAKVSVAMAMGVWIVRRMLFDPRWLVEATKTTIQCRHSLAFSRAVVITMLIRQFHTCAPLNSLDNAWKGALVLARRPINITFRTADGFRWHSTHPTFYCWLSHIACAPKRSSKGWQDGPASAATLVRASAIIQLRAATMTLPSPTRAATRHKSMDERFAAECGLRD